jgi:hypothetical protein
MAKKKTTTRKKTAKKAAKKTTRRSNTSARAKAAAAQRKLAVRRAAFLAAYVNHLGDVMAASKAAGISRGCHYQWLADPQYKAQFEQIERELGDVVQAALTRRAVEGVPDPIYHQGECVGHKQRYSDQGAIALLRGLKPDTFRDRVDLSGDGGALPAINVIVKGGDA